MIRQSTSLLNGVLGNRKIRKTHKIYKYYERSLHRATWNIKKPRFVICMGVFVLKHNYFFARVCVFFCFYIFKYNIIYYQISYIHISFTWYILKFVIYISFYDYYHSIVSRFFKITHTFLSPIHFTLLSRHNKSSYFNFTSVES